MRISPTAQQMAVYEIFSRYRVPAGGRLRIDEIESDWHATGLRRADLVDGLGQMINRGAVRIESDTDGIFVVLTAVGRTEAVETQPGLRGLWEESRSISTLARARQRPRTATSATGRRMTDRAGV